MAVKKEAHRLLFCPCGVLQPLFALIVLKFESWLFKFVYTYLIGSQLPFKGIHNGRLSLVLLHGVLSAEISNRVISVEK